MTEHDIIFDENISFEPEAPRIALKVAKECKGPDDESFETDEDEY